MAGSLIPARERISGLPPFVVRCRHCAEGSVRSLRAWIDPRTHCGGARVATEKRLLVFTRTCRRCPNASLLVHSAFAGTLTAWHLRKGKTRIATFHPLL